MLFSHVKISSFRAKAHLVFHWCLYNKCCYYPRNISFVILRDKFLPFDCLRVVVFQLNLKNLHVKITNLFGVLVYCLYVIFGINTTRDISKLPEISLA